jgi:hypothetical protein
MQVQRHGAGIFTISDFLSPPECDGFISRSESRGFVAAGIQIDGEEQMLKDVRNNDRVIWDDPPLAASLFERARPLLPADVDGHRLTGLNDRFRYYRYGQTQRFDWHFDGSVVLPDGQESLLTFMVYLNDDFAGGRTEFGWESIAPVRGLALVFPHHRRHRGAAVTSGHKYVLRSDVMYRKAGSD